MKRWFARPGKEQDLAESQERIRETEETHAQVHRQWPEVRRLVEGARKQREANHLTDLFLAIHRERP